MTEWRTIPGHPTHEACRAGDIRNAQTKHVLKPRRLPTGYTRVSLPGARDLYIHDVILKTFVGPRPAGCQASHKNGVNSDNRVVNLAWETPSKNNQRKTRHGTQKFGADNPMGKKTECLRGHAFTESNTRRANGKRICRTCARDHMRKRRAARKAA